MSQVLIGVGSNLGDREDNIRQAVSLLAELPETRIVSQSSLKEYPAAEGAAGQGPFLNGAILIETELAPTDLLYKCQVIERRIGRSSKNDHADRPIDLDLLFYSREVVIQGKNLQIPHPRLQNRIFVLETLEEIAADWIHPRLGRSIRELREDLEGPHENRDHAGGIADVPPQSPHP
ncbi:MAG: 2-amino-4-hydroxy-6-hydroxymethyldihydropteridine diphosphokinase [Candidatus Omnitrophica bacterium]|nr:2-amino-4-hydroxy-6-hydroxymethyldihydropteridine diphosphokinase [Candidatus Omnitrophota bacterium]